MSELVTDPNATGETSDRTPVADSATPIQDGAGEPQNHSATPEEGEGTPAEPVVTAEPADAADDGVEASEATAPVADVAPSEAAVQSAAEGLSSATEPSASRPSEAAPAEAVASIEAQSSPVDTTTPAPAVAAVEPPAVEAPAPAQAEPQAVSVDAAAPAEPQLAPVEAPAPAPVIAVAEAPAAAAEAPAAPADAPQGATVPAPQADDADAAAGSRRQQVTQRILAAWNETKPIEGKVIGWNKGGFHVTLQGIAAFCPRSLMELGNPRKPAAYLDQTFLFRITNVDEENRRIVVSRKEILEEERRNRREEVRKRLSVGAVLRGRVESLVDFGAFVDLDGGLKGLVHLSEISRRRIEHPKEVLRNGQEVDVKVIRVEKGGDRISLSIRALEPDPWDKLAEVYPTGATFEGKIVRQSEFGLFVEVAEGVEGLVHTSQLPLGTDMTHASLQPGETISGWVREVDTGRHRLSLTLRELPAGDPWAKLHERYQEGQAIKGRVEHATKFGFFVELEPGVTGLLPFSEVSTPPGRRKENMYHPGQQVTVQILQLDTRRRRISLGSEGSKVEGSTADYRAYVKRQQRDTGLNALAAAFEKLKQSP